MGTGDLPLIDPNALEQAADCLRTLAHPIRLRMIHLLMNGTYTVGELASACEIARHMASEHLRLMQHCGFLSRRREGRYTYYEIAEPHLQDLMKCLVNRFGTS